MTMETRSELTERTRPTATHIGPTIKMISEALMRDGNRSLGKEGITFSQMMTLDALCDSPGGPLSQSQLAEALRVSHPTVVGLIGRMEEKGLVETAVSPHDRRMRLVSVTERGRDAWERCVSSRNHADAVMLEGLSDKQAHALSEMLEKVLSNLLDAERGAGQQRSIADAQDADEAGSR